MALINCTECKKEISDKATACPSCGAPVKEINVFNANKNQSDSKGISKITAALIGFLFGFLIVVVGCGTNHVNFISPASIIGGSILGSLLGILGFLLGSDKNK
jgi:hypothetical protein